MKKTVLSIYHGKKGKQRSPITFHFPEPDPRGSVHIGKLSDAGKGWQTRSLSAAGIGRLFCYRQYTVTQPATFITEPSEPAICLRIHVGKGAAFGYQEEKTRLQLDFMDNRIFWQGDRITENRLMEDEHTLVELYVRPECLSHLADRKAVMDIIDQSLTERNGPIDQYVFSGSGELDSFLWNMLEEIDTKSTSVERFHYLCDCLLLMCLGEKVEVEPRPDTEEEELSEEDSAGDRRYEPSPSEQEILSELEGKDRNGLLGELHTLRAETDRLKQTVRRERELGKEVKGVAEAISRLPHEKLGKEYMKAAYLLAGWHKSKKIPAKNRKILKQAIVSSCESAFALRSPAMEEMDFYVEWSGRPYISAPMGADIMTDLLSLFLPPGAPKLTPMDETLRSGNLLLEQIREAFGFKSMSEIKGETAQDRPKEVVELYQRLMDHFCDTLDLGKEGEILRSDIVRELDAAYQQNDLLTLLQIEAENLAGDPDYIGRQDDERLRWLIVGLRSDRDNYRVMLEEMEESPAYHELQRFHRLGDDMEKFRRHLERDLKKMIPVSDEFSSLLVDITEHPSAGKAMMLAESLLASRLEE
ncbi:hypothetical protein [Sphingobacterium chuzhouense]|uniref:Uncharacterized protein n=1 Tax=Sphingobacterium chuzhouense TaxID=1742264 RepID=A0ABR7XPA0_9SPHI|nr:hypothetical protein [Sphingobacterium chuzhouense]MBD1420990.1 hypothetical protein [Sphingobacterium chuzhouense]